jgi:hypothetical protein
MRLGEMVQNTFSKLEHKNNYGNNALIIWNYTVAIIGKYYVSFILEELGR